MATGNPHLDRLDELVQAVAQGRAIKHYEISLASHAIECLTRELRQLTTCGCGSVRLPGMCSGYCDQDV